MSTYLIQYRNRKMFWDGRQKFCWMKSTSFDLKRDCRIRTLLRAEKPRLEIAKTLTVKELPPFKMSADTALFKKGMKRVGIAGILATLLFTLLEVSEAPSTPDEKLIPKKYAKLILAQPKQAPSTSKQGSAAIARAFRSKSVQKSLKNILQGGLSRYSIMATGKSIQNLQQKITSGENQKIASLSSMTDRAVGSLSVGGHGTGIGTGIKGQGHGQIEIGILYQDASVDEGLTKEEVAKVIHGHMNEIRYCYEAAITNDPSLAGKVLVDFKIGASGRVAIAHASENTVKDLQVGNCLLGKLKSWKFPEPRGGVQVAVTYPFLFKSVHR